MTDPKDLIQEDLVTKDDNPSPEYHKLLEAYFDNPFYDMIVKKDEQRKEESKSKP